MGAEYGSPFGGVLSGAGGCYQPASQGPLFAGICAQDQANIYPIQETSISIKRDEMPIPKMGE